MNDVKLINQILEKIQNSLDEVNHTVFHPKSIDWWHYKTIRLTKESQKIIDIVDPFSSPNTEIVTPASYKNMVCEQKTLIPKDCNIPSIDMEISKKIYKWVLEDKMLQSGHFEVTDERHVRDWIDTSKLLENMDYLNPIISSFIKILKQKDLTKENTIIIGEGFPGLILASQIGFIGGYGCTYMIPDQNVEQNETHYELPDIPKDKEIVLVTDVIAEAITIFKSLDYLQTKHNIPIDKISAILSVFYREPHKKSSEIRQNIWDRIIALNTDFKIETCENQPKDCILKKNKLVVVYNAKID